MQREKTIRNILRKHCKEKIQHFYYYSDFWEVKIGEINRNISIRDIFIEFSGINYLGRQFITVYEENYFKQKKEIFLIKDLKWNNIIKTFENFASYYF